MRILLLAIIAAALMAAPALADPTAASTTAKPGLLSVFKKKPAATTGAGQGGSMKACAAQWRTIRPAEKAQWKAKGAAMKTKTGKPMNDYQAFSSDCMKKG